MRITQVVEKSWIRSGRGSLGGVALLLVTAAVVGYWTIRVLDEPLQSPEALATDNLRAISQLTSKLAEEVAARQAVSQKLAELEERISLLNRRDQEAQTEALAERTSSNGKESEDSLAELDDATGISGFDDDVLLDRGVHPLDVERLHDVWAKDELDRQSIADRALREGWFMQKQHGAELAQLDRALREDLDDADYDRYLYATGERNRLRVGEVLKSSAGGAAGLRAGDMIVRYDDVRLFQPGDLLLAAAGGEPGDVVPMEIVRDGTRRTIYVEVGPLGAKIEHESRPPLGE